MAKAYSEDLRLRILEAVHSGATIREIGKRYNVSPSFVSKISCLYKREGHIKAKSKRKQRPSILDSYAVYISEIIKKKPDITLEELRKWLIREHQVKVAVCTIHRFLRSKLQMTYKKKAFSPQSKIGLMFWKNGNHGAKKWLLLTGKGLYSLMKLRLRPI